jgi:hypothetical protein
MAIEYSQKVMGGGACILKNGRPMTPNKIVQELNDLHEIASTLAELINGKKSKAACDKLEEHF